MVRKSVCLVLFFALLSTLSFAQNKAVVLQNVWNNELNSYNPQEFIDKLLIVFKDKLLVKDFIADSKNLTQATVDSNWNRNIKNQIKATKTAGDAYFISLASDLRLPAVNLGKLLFKNPPRSSKLTLTLHIYDSAANEVLGDTIINRGCVVRTVDEDKGKRFFYADYDNFMTDMLCHLETIRRILQEKPLLKKQRRYLEAK